MSHIETENLDHRPSSALSLKTSVEISDQFLVEFIALLLLAPLIWSSSHPEVPLTSEPTIVVSLPSRSRPHVENDQGRFLIHPPPDTRLTMTVLEHAAIAKNSRGPASVAKPKMIEVIVTAP